MVITSGTNISKTYHILILLSSLQLVIYVRRMALLKLTKSRIFIFIACTILPTFFLFHGIQTSFSDHFSFSFSSPVANETLPSTTPDKIINNNATYPRLYFKQPHALYATQAKVLLARLQSRRKSLFDSVAENLNNEMMDKLITLLGRAEWDENYVPPTVRGFSWLFHV